MSAGFCPHCGAPNSARAPFCGRCGRPLAAGTTLAAGAAYPMAAAADVRSMTGGGRSLRLLWILLAVTVVAAGGAEAAALYIGSHPAATTGCQKFCIRTHLPPPLGAPRTYTSSALGWSMQYQDDLPLSKYVPTRQTVNSATAIGWTLSYQGDWPTTVTSEPAAGRSAEQVVDHIRQATLAGSTLVFALPGAEIGYQGGYGAVYDLQVATSQGASVHARAVVLAAVRKGVAVELICLSPYYDHSNNYPILSGNVFIGSFDSLTNTVTWSGDPPH